MESPPPPPLPRALLLSTGKSNRSPLPPPPPADSRSRLAGLPGCIRVGVGAPRCDYATGCGIGL